MRRNSNLLTLAIIMVILSTIIYFSVHLFNYICFISNVDVEYVEKLNNALKNYDINALDECLGEKAEICYSNRNELYYNCRENILYNMQKRNYDISMYGGGNNIFDNGIQEINTQVYGKVSNKDYGENSITVYLKMVEMDKFEIVKLESDDEILEKLFLTKN